MKIAISGKGGVGKTTLAVILARIFFLKGSKVLAIDADPDANLALALGFDGSEEITPLSEMRELIAERTGAEPGSFGAMFKMNPKVDDLPDAISREIDGIKFLVMGGVKKGGGGCVCPESVMLKQLVSHLVLARNEVVIIDMEAGLEHLGRGTASSVNKLLVVVEPGRRSLDTAQAVRRLAQDLKLMNIAIVGNKVRNESDEAYIRSGLPDFEILGFIPYNDEVIEADLSGGAVYKNAPATVKAVQQIYQNLVR
ncbi:MAG: AAA family ATPase [Deltaproteobacteria bacterium]|nr:AAA family ATPase [Deltaproteobacteria bacterium]